MKSDIEIAREANMLPVQTVAEKLDITADELDLYGKYKAKLTDELWERIKDRPDGKLVLVTAIIQHRPVKERQQRRLDLDRRWIRLGKRQLLLCVSHR